MTAVRKLISLTVLLAAMALALLLLVMPLIQLFGEQMRERAAMQARLANLAQPINREAGQSPNAPVIDPASFLSAATDEEAAAQLGNLVSTLMSPGIVLQSSVPAGSTVTPVLVEDKLDLSVQMAEAEMPGFLLRLESSRPILRLARLSVRRLEQQGQVSLTASIIGFRVASPPAPSSSSDGEQPR
jgi:hypothetical protein